MNTPYTAPSEWALDYAEVLYIYNILVSYEHTVHCPPPPLPPVRIEEALEHAEV